MYTSQKGQAILVVVLIMVIVLTIGLAVAARTVTNLRIATEEENSQRAFSAAEAGIEKILPNLGSPGLLPIVDLDLLNNSKIKRTDFRSLGGQQILLLGGTPITKDIGADLWLSTYSDDPALIYTSGYTGSYLSVYWGSNSDSCLDSALEIFFVSGPKATPSTKRFAFDDCVARRSSNNFTAATAGNYTIQGTTFTHRITFDAGSLPANPLIARIIPLYYSSVVAVTGCNSALGNCTNFPIQGYIVDSTGESNNTLRKISYLRGFPSVPNEFFSYLLLSP